MHIDVDNAPKWDPRNGRYISRQFCVIMTQRLYKNGRFEIGSKLKVIIVPNALHLLFYTTGQLNTYFQKGTINEKEKY